MGDENCEKVHLTRAVSFSKHDVTSKCSPDIEVNLTDIRACLATEDSAEKLGCKPSHGGGGYTNEDLLHFAVSTLLLHLGIINIQ